jgi:hypothetical protein
MPAFSIVGRKFSPSAFADYMAHVPLERWTPRRIVLHNTAIPNLADRPSGLTQEHIENLHFYFQYRAPVRGRPVGWSGGPHLFVDQTGIWVFNPLDRRGTHSPSYNANGWGVEMLGDFDRETFAAGDGQRVQTNTLAALAAMFRRLDISNVSDANFKFHKEDPQTDHDCPGRNVDKATVKTAVQALLNSAASGVWPEVPARVVVYRTGRGQSPSAVINAVMRNGTVFADVAELAQATGLAIAGTGEVAVRAFTEAAYDVNWRPELNRVYLVEK